MSDDPTEPHESAPLAGAPTAPGISSYERQNRRSRLLALAITIGAIVLSYAVYRLATATHVENPTQKVLPKSEPAFPLEEKRKVEERPAQSRLQIDPPIIVFPDIVATKERQYKSITLTAIDGPVDIADVSLPFAQESDLDMRAETCINRKLAKSESCGISISFVPLQAVTLNNSILIRGTIYESQGDLRGKTSPLSMNINISGSARLPPPPPPPVVVPNYEAEREDRLKSAFLTQRQRLTLGDQAGRVYWKGPKLAVDTDWKSVGFGKSESSYPVDMSRVVTMDKSIPVVVKVPIDTRNSSRAVATVERDIYGGDGRVVIIERGSTLIGTVGSIADTSEEKVGISWLRLIRPDGVAFSFHATSGDAMGRSGVLAHIDNRWGERFGKAALLSFLRGGITLALNPNQTAVTQNGTSATGVSGSITTGGTTSVSENARTIANQQVQSDLLPLYDEYMKEQLSLPPIRTVPVGTRITVWPTADLWLRPVGTGEAIDEPTAGQGNNNGIRAAKGYALPAGGGQAAIAAGGVTQRSPTTLNDVLSGNVPTDTVPGAAPPPSGAGLGIITPAGTDSDQPAVPEVDTSLSDKTASQINVQRYSAKPQAATTQGSGQAITSTGQSIPNPPWNRQ